MERVTAYEHGIYAVDAVYMRPQWVAIHLIVESGRVAVVDTGTSHALPTVLATLARLGLTVDAVDWVILTHVHLDHAGGAGAMMQTFPTAKLLVHPRGARHMIDPSKLIAGTQAVYGVEATRRLYGEIVPVDAARVVEANDGFVATLAGRELLCLDTPGHARHHIAVVDRGSGGIFTGDNFGVSYRELDDGARQFVFPTTTPVQLEPEAMHATLDRLLGFAPSALYLTHFGRLVDAPARGADLHRQVDALVRLALGVEADGLTGEARHARLRAGVEAIVRDELLRYAGPLPLEDAVALHANDIELNAQGLGVWLDTRAKA